ncbi:RING-4 [Ilyonectria robusta]|uniref:RING-4 n=1 Tax=Ilyonectria robusta TaxID=1079257 RepID=UPI001E8CDC6B|nr:RING-4 [Ilyonectria robusta]KAH8673173.1 RING-4 [Ilyonectria robusta]
MEPKRPGDGGMNSAETPPHAKRVQVPRACQRCKTLRRGCNEFRPCRRCVDAGLGDHCTPQSSMISLVMYPASPLSPLSPGGGVDPVQSMAELVPLRVIDYCAERFFARLYPTIPILTRDYLAHLKAVMASSSEWRVEAYCVLVAMCAQVLLQAEEPENLFPQGIISEKNAVYGQIILDVALATHQRIPRNVKPTFNQCLLVFFLYACQARLSHHSQAFLFLREATTLLHLLRFDHVDATFKDLAGRLFWVLLISERSHAIRYRRPITLQVTPETPELDTSDERLVGFWSLAALFRPIETSFVALLNHEIVATPPSPAAIDYVETSVNTALKPTLELHDTQKANLRVTQLWLRVIIWKLRLRLGYLSEGASQHSLTYSYPLEVAKELTLSTRDLPLDSIKVHGVGLTEKLYDIASAVVDVLARVPIAPSSPQGLVMGRSLEDDLIYIRHLITQLPSGTSTYDPLLEKQIQQALPTTEPSPADEPP